jgi:hypothetical protein
MVPDVVVAAQAIEQGLESRREWLNTNVDGICIRFLARALALAQRCGQAIESAPPIGRRYSIDVLFVYCRCRARSGTEPKRTSPLYGASSDNHNDYHIHNHIYLNIISDSRIRSCAASLSEAEPARRATPSHTGHSTNLQPTGTRQSRP